jgi:hypothetical protein
VIRSSIHESADDELLRVPMARKDNSAKRTWRDSAVMSNLALQAACGGGKYR